MLASVSLAMPATAAGAESSRQGMFGIATGGAIQNEDASALSTDLDAIARAGSEWVRVDINWAQIQAEGPSSYTWDATDEVVRSATDRGMKILGVIVYTPDWARPPGTSAGHGPDSDAYAKFAATAVERYAALGVHAYEVWNEANLERFWSPTPDPAAYTELLRRSYPAIKAADPQATVLTAGTAPAGLGAAYSPADFLRAIYANGGAGSFDAVAHHPYCWPALPGGQSCAAWQEMHASDPSLRSVMAANGDGDKKIWATEFGAPTGGPGGVSEDEQAQAVMRAYSLWRTYEWAGPLFAFSGRDRGTGAADSENFFGLLRHDFSEKPAFAAYQAAVEGASQLDDGPPSSDTDLTVAVRGSRRAPDTVRGKVSAGPASTRPRTTPTGQVQLALCRKVHGGCRRVSRRLPAQLQPDGRFREPLSPFRLRSRPRGIYRVHGRFLGPPTVTRSEDLSNRFRLR